MPDREALLDQLGEIFCELALDQLEADMTSENKNHVDDDDGLGGGDGHHETGPGDPRESPRTST